MKAVIKQQGAEQGMNQNGFILLNRLYPIIPLHPQHIRKMVRRGEFPEPFKIGGRTAFLSADIYAWIEQQKMAKPTGAWQRKFLREIDEQSRPPAADAGA